MPLSQNYDAASLSAPAKGEPPEPRFSHKECEVLRRLAGRVAELAARPGEEEKRRLWYRHNALEATRPLIFCDPENGWNEIIRRQPGKRDPLVPHRPRRGRQARLSNSIPHR